MFFKLIVFSLYLLYFIYIIDINFKSHTYTVSLSICPNPPLYMSSLSLYHSISTSTLIIYISPYFFIYLYIFLSFIPFLPISLSIITSFTSSP